MATTITFNGTAIWTEGSGTLGPSAFQPSAFVPNTQDVTIPNADGVGLKLLGGGRAEIPVGPLTFIDSSQSNYGTVYDTLQAFVTAQTIGTLALGSYKTFGNCRLADFRFLDKAPVWNAGSGKHEFRVILLFEQRIPDR